MKDNLTIKGKEYKFPIYLPDATRAVVRSLDSQDLNNIGVQGVVVNTYHLMTNPGMSVLKKIGGIKKFMGFDGLVVSDSGGWQIFSMIHRPSERVDQRGLNADLRENKRYSGGMTELSSGYPELSSNREHHGRITDEGVIFGSNNKKKELFSPEKSIQVQFDIGSDIIICLDDFTDPKAKPEQVKKSVERTILWAQKSREEFDQQIKERKLTDENRPHIFAVIKGSWDRKLRKYCAEELLKIGFDGYGYGGYTVNDKKEQDLKMAKFVAELIPNEYPKFALGSGKPVDIARFTQLGWNIFDCVLPTRDARHKRLYVFKKDIKTVKDLADPKNHDHVYIHREKYRRDEKPISQFCDCHTCQNFSRAYLHHLFNIDDFAAYRLATIHNLRVYMKVIQMLRK